MGVNPNVQKTIFLIWREGIGLLNTQRIKKVCPILGTHLSCLLKISCNQHHLLLYKYYYPNLWLNLEEVWSRTLC
jgi:hypothetical protein